MRTVSASSAKSPGCGPREFDCKNALLSTVDLKIDLVIHPEELTAQEIVRLVKLRAGNDILDIAQGQIQMLATRINESSPLAFRKLKEVSQIHRDFYFRVVAVARGITTILPGGEHKLLPHDQVYMMAGSEDLPRLMEITRRDTAASPPAHGSWRGVGGQPRGRTAAKEASRSGSSKKTKSAPRSCHIA